MGRRLSWLTLEILPAAVKYENLCTHWRRVGLGRFGFALRGRGVLVGGMETEIRHPDEGDEFWTGERCAILESSNTAEDPEVSIARARVAPGVTTAWHKLEGVVERYLMVSGRGRVEAGDLPAEEVGPGDVVRIPAGVRQRITNAGEGDLVFYAICSPRFVPECYVDLEGSG